MAIDRAELAFIRNLVYRRSAILVGADREYLVEARLGPLAREEGFDSIRQLVDRLRSHPPNGLHAKVVDAMTTNETTFFRDVHPFEALRDHVFPALQKARATARSLQIWSAACSTGQEPYSVAMVLHEHFPDMTSWRVRILGTDLSATALARAQEGAYSQLEVNRGLPAALLPKYFERVGAKWAVKPALRRMVDCSAMNLIEPWPHLARVDVVFLRNVLIYFDVPTKRAILARVRQVLVPDGYLFLGSSETTHNVDDSFERIQVGKSIYYRPVQ